MNSISRAVSKSNSQTRLLQTFYRTIKKNFYSTASKEEIFSALKKWKVIALIMQFGVCAYLVKILREPEEEPEQSPAPYAHIRSKPFPWGDGDTELFKHLDKSFLHIHHKPHPENDAVSHSS